MSTWMLPAMVVVNSILVVLFIVGGFFMTRSYLRKMKKNS